MLGCSTDEKQTNHAAPDQTLIAQIIDIHLAQSEENTNIYQRHVTKVTVIKVSSCSEEAVCHLAYQSTINSFDDISLRLHYAI